MKTTAREFFRKVSAQTAKLKPGQTLLVTNQGKPDLLVTKAGPARRNVPNAAGVVSRQSHHCATGDALIEACLREVA
jgi:hypothetical protein